VVDNGHKTGIEWDSRLSRAYIKAHPKNAQKCAFVHPVEKQGKNWVKLHPFRGELSHFKHRFLGSRHAVPNSDTPGGDCKYFGLLLEASYKWEAYCVSRHGWCWLFGLQGCHENREVFHVLKIDIDMAI
jgi:hypothetical protein